MYGDITRNGDTVHSQFITTQNVLQIISNLNI